MRLADHDIVALGVGHFFNSPDNQRKKTSVNRGYDNTNDITSSVPEGCSNMIGLVIKFFGGMLYSLLCRVADARMILQCPRNG
jgi:hypothetical protein